ncbi:MAG: hypothetical protein BGO95_03070 [Micrococcales bacterium 73-13]|nr:MAG: hypothetical protein BGO95_03070 [Micrococcales bacterium 73-13]
MQQWFAESAAACRRGLILFGRGFAGSALSLVLMSALTGLATVVAVTIATDVAWAQRAELFADGTIRVEGLLRLLLTVGIPFALVVAVLAAGGFAAAATVFADRHRGASPSRGTRFATAILGGARRALPLLGALVVAVLEVALAVVLAPLVSLAGLVLLAVFGVRRLIGRPRTANPWFAWPMLVAYAVPLGLVAVIWVHSLLILPVAALERRGVPGILRRSSELVRGGALRVVLLALLGTLLYAVPVLGLQALGALLGWGSGGVLLWVQVVLQVLLAGVPVALLVAAYFDRAGSIPPELVVRVPWFRRSPALGPVAAAVAGALVLSLAVAVPAPRAWAEGGEGSGRPPLELAITDLGDASDANPGDGICATAADTCTLRAAIEENNAWQPSGLSMISPADAGIAVGTVLLGSVIEVTQGVQLYGSGWDGYGAVGLTIDGGGTAQLLRFATPSNAISTLRDLVLANGYSAGDGGAIEVLSGTVGLENVTATGNGAAGSGGAFWGASTGADGPASLDVRGSRLEGNSVPACNGAFFDPYAGAPSTIEPSSDASCSTAGPGPDPDPDPEPEGPVATTVALAATSDEPNGWFYRGRPVRLTATVVPAAGTAVPTGVVTFTGSSPTGSEIIGTASVGLDGRAVLDATIPAIDGLQMSDSLFWQVAAQYDGDAGHLASHDPDGLDIGLEPDATEVTVTPSTLIARPGDPVTFTVRVRSQVPGTTTIPGGAVFLSAAGALLDGPNSASLNASGEASFTARFAGFGTFVVEADYQTSGPRFRASTGSLDYVLAGSYTTIVSPVLVGVTNPSYAGEEVQVLVGVGSSEAGPGAPALTGWVRLMLDDTQLDRVPLGDNTILRTSVLPVGSHSLRVEYEGDEHYAPASSTLAHQVVKLPTAVYLGALPSSVVGQPLSLTATVSTDVLGRPVAAVTSGLVQIKSGAELVATIDLASGDTVQGVLPVAVGTQQLTAVYLGDDRHTGATSAPLAHSQSRAGVEVLLALAEDQVPITGALTATVAVTAASPSTGAPSGGGVELYSDGVLVASGELSDGGVLVLEHDVRELGAGTHQLRARYTGSAGFDPSLLGAAVPITALRHAPTLVLTGVSATDPAAGQPLTAVVELPWAQQPVSTPLGRVVFEAWLPDGSGGGSWVAAAGGTGDDARVDLDDDYREARITIPFGTLPLGTHRLRVSYQPSAEYQALGFTASVSAEVDLDFAAIPTRIEALGLEGTVQASGEARAQTVFVYEMPQVADRVPGGTVTATLDGAQLGGGPLALAPMSDPLVIAGTVDLALPPLDPGQHTLHLLYTPGDGVHASSEQTVVFSAAGRQPTVTLLPSTTGPALDALLMVTTGLVVDAGAPKPSGRIVVSDGSGAPGADCTVNVAPSTREASCYLVFTTAGTRTLTARFEPAVGEQVYEAASSSPVAVTVASGATALNVSVGSSASPAAPTAGDTVTVGWSSIGGPASTDRVSVQVSPANAVGEWLACGSGIAGTCGFRLSKAGADAALVTVTVSFSGDDRYAPASSSGTIAPRACVALDLRAVPAGAGTVTPRQPANCGEPGAAKDGYAVGSLVTFQVGANPSGDPGYDWVPVEAGDVVRTADGLGTGLVVTRTGNWAEAAFERSANCVLVTVDLSVVAGTTGGLRLPGEAGATGPAPNCALPPGVDPATYTAAWHATTAWTPDGTARRTVATAWYLRGTVLSGIAIVPGKSDTKFYAETSRDFTREGDWGYAPRTLDGHATLTAAIGPTCYPATATATGPGTVTILNPENCADPSTGVHGWSSDTVLDVLASPTRTAAGAAADATSGVLHFAWLWQGTDRLNGTAEPSGASARDAIDAALRRAAVGTQPAVASGAQLDTVLVVAGRAAPAVTVDFGTCYAVTLGNGRVTDGTVLQGPGSLATPSNCPHPQARSASASGFTGLVTAGGISDRAFFTAGTRVTVQTPQNLEDQKDVRRSGQQAYSGELAQFAGWLRGGRLTSTREPELSLVLDGPVQLQPRYFFARDCLVSLTVYSRDAERVQPQVMLQDVPPNCDEGSLGSGPAAYLSGSLPGNATSADPTRELARSGSILLTAHVADGLDPLVGWVLSANVDAPSTVQFQDGASGGAPSTRTVRDVVQGAELRIERGFNSLSAQAVTCQQLDYRINVTREDGVRVTDYQSDDDLLLAYPAPNCPFAPNAWLTGTRVELWALGNPLGYRFTGWSGEVGAEAMRVGDGAQAGGPLAGTQLAADLGDDAAEVLGEIPAGAVTTVTMDGTSPVKRVEADYQVVCHDVTIEQNAGFVDWYPAPNCPGFEDEVRTTQYSHRELADMYRTGTALSPQQWRELEQKAGTKTKTGRFIGGTELLIRANGIKNLVWKGWTGDVVQTGRVNPGTVVVAKDSVVQNPYREKTSGEELEDFGNDVAVFAKKAVGFGAVVVTDYLINYPPIGTVTMVAEGMALVSTLLQMAGVPKDGVEWMRYAKETIDMLKAPLSCAGTWGLGSSTSGAVGGVAGLASEAAKQKTYRITNIGDAAESLAEHQARMSAGETGVYMSTKLSYYQAKLGLATLAKNVMPAVSTGLAIYGAVQGGGYSWDADAASAWTDGSAYTNCIKNSLPSYMQGIVDDRTVAALADYGKQVQQQIASGQLDYSAYAGTSGASTAPRRRSPRGPRSRGRR